MGSSECTTHRRDCGELRCAQNLCNVWIWTMYVRMCMYVRTSVHSYVLFSTPAHTHVRTYVHLYILCFSNTCAYSQLFVSIQQVTKWYAYLGFKWEVSLICLVVVPRSAICIISLKCKSDCDLVDCFWAINLQFASTLVIYLDTYVGKSPIQSFINFAFTFIDLVYCVNIHFMEYVLHIDINYS